MEIGDGRSTLARRDARYGEINIGRTIKSYGIDVLEHVEDDTSELSLAADHLARAGWRGAGEHTTVRDLAGWLGVLLGHAPGFIDEAAEREARFQAVRISGASAGAGLRREQDYLRAAWRTRLNDPVAGLPAVVLYVAVAGLPSMGGGLLNPLACSRSPS